MAQSDLPSRIMSDSAGVEVSNTVPITHSILKGDRSCLCSITPCGVGMALIKTGTSEPSNAPRQIVELCTDVSTFLLTINFVHNESAVHAQGFNCCDKGDARAKEPVFLTTLSHSVAAASGQNLQAS